MEKTGWKNGINTSMSGVQILSYMSMSYKLGMEGIKNITMQ